MNPKTTKNKSAPSAESPELVEYLVKTSFVLHRGDAIGNNGRKYTQGQWIPEGITVKALPANMIGAEKCMAVERVDSRDSKGKAPESPSTESPKPIAGK